MKKYHFWGVFRLGQGNPPLAWKLSQPWPNFSHFFVWGGPITLWIDEILPPHLCSVCFFTFMDSCKVNLVLENFAKKLGFGQTFPLVGPKDQLEYSPYWLVNQFLNHKQDIYWFANLFSNHEQNIYWFVNQILNYEQNIYWFVILFLNHEQNIYWFVNQFESQSLTRVSISRNSRREITLGFPSRAGEMNFHVSFSSRFSRFWENISLSPLGSQDFCIELLFLLSIFKIL